ncbi:MAG: type IV pilus twitching motility protein PilT [Armatimonadetes bacterium]|nr:type IV pilus twitching motility protein PilT [Armatimonadota bacterium]
MASIDALLNEVITRGASDLHLTSDSPPIVRTHGVLERLSAPVMTAEDIEEMVAEILTDEEIEELKQTTNLDHAYEVTSPKGELLRFRGNIYFQRTGLDAVFRAIPARIPTLSELGLPGILAKLTRYHQGLILATGPSGSGKTSTLAALVHIINEERSCHIVTIEDPIEYIHINRKSLINQRQVGLHTRSFQSALRAALREDPDVIVVGELRDLETIRLAITASETGHLVFGTLQTSTAAKTIDRIIDSFPSEQQAQIRMMLSESLRGIIAQQLIPIPSGAGRIPAVEIIVGCQPIANLIRESKTYQIPSVMQTGKNLGMQTMDESLMALAVAGKITPFEAYERATEKAPFDNLIKEPQEK